MTKAEKAAYMRKWRAEHPGYRAWLKATYGARYRNHRIRKDRWNALLEESDGLCAACYEAPATDVDHDHETGEVRGALCGPCNRGMGQFADSTERLRLAADYLETPIMRDERLMSFRRRTQ